MNKFVPRLTTPSSSSKFWKHYTKGGYNYCITIYDDTNCLPNCVGYAWGRDIEARGLTYTKLSRFNAENWYPKIDWNDGYNRGQVPKIGAIACWAKGVAGVYSDGAGHVAYVEEINGDTITLSNSAYKSTTFYLSKMKAPFAVNGYTFQGFIYPDGIEEWNSEEIPVKELKYNEGDKVIISGELYGSSNDLDFAGTIKHCVTTITRTNPESLHPYNTEGDLGWMDEEDITLYIESEHDFKIGDKVKIVGGYSGSANGATLHSTAIGWTRYVLDIIDGADYPYAVGSLNGIITGYFKAESIINIG